MRISAPGAGLILMLAGCVPPPGGSDRDGVGGGGLRSGLEWDSPAAQTESPPEPATPEPVAPSPAPAAQAGPAAPAPALQIDPIRFVGRGEGEMRALFGEPAFARTEGPGVMWQYRNDACVAFVFFHTRQGTRRVVHMESRPRNGSQIGAAHCFGQFVDPEMLEQLDPRSQGSAVQDRPEQEQNRMEHQ